MIPNDFDGLSPARVNHYVPVVEIVHGADKKVLLHVDLSRNNIAATDAYDECEDYARQGIAGMFVLMSSFASSFVNRDNNLETHDCDNPHSILTADHVYQIRVDARTHPRRTSLGTLSLHAEWARKRFSVATKLLTLDRTLVYMVVFLDGNALLYRIMQCLTSRTDVHPSCFIYVHTLC